jgi:hypothetical protein
LPRWAGFARKWEIWAIGAVSSCFARSSETDIPLNLGDMVLGRPPPGAAASMDPREYQIAVRGGRQREMTLGDMAFECPACGWRADRDYNASLNMLRRAGWEPPAAPAELHPLPVALGRGQGGQ